MIITPSMLENSLKTLGCKSDSSNANKQARERARKIVRAHAENIAAWISKSQNPNSLAHKTLRQYISALQEISK